MIIFIMTFAQKGAPGFLRNKIRTSRKIRTPPPDYVCKIMLYDENVRCHRYDRRSRHHSRHQQLFCKTVATSHLTHARCVNLISDCGSLCCGTPHSESSAVAAITEGTVGRLWAALGCCSLYVSHDGWQILLAEWLQRWSWTKAFTSSKTLLG